MLFIFDMGGVVTSTFTQERLCARLGITQNEFASLCKDKTTNENLFDNLQKGFITTKDFWQGINNALLQKGLQATKTDLFRLYFHPVLNAKTVELIKALKKNHRVVCGTNTIQSHYENHLERGDYSFFDQTYSSHAIHAIKPNADFFELILEAEDAKPSETFFTDDKIENIKGAQKLGINATLFTSAEYLYNAWKNFI